MEKISEGYFLPSSAYNLTKRQIKGYFRSEEKPEIGDVIFGVIDKIGQHSSLENREGRIHSIQKGSKAIFVFGNRYAPDYYEGFVPENNSEYVDLLARSGVVGKVKSKSSKVIDPTRVKVLGYVCQEQGAKLNTRNFPLIIPRFKKKKKSRSKMILIVGTSMNSGKSAAAMACCWTLKTMGFKVRASKVTGTASLKDILHMNDAGAYPYADFTYLGYPSTYMLAEEEMIGIFNKLDLKYANNKDNFWVVEFADGIIQRETAMLLRSEDVKSRIHKLIFCAADAFGVIGGLDILQREFNLVPHAISGVCSSSPLHVEELSKFTHVPVFNSLSVNAEELINILTQSNPKKKKIKVESTNLTA
jgi:hypothetical protein